MRAAHNLRALSEKFSVHLLIVAIYGGHEGWPSDEVLSFCAGWRRIDVSLSPVNDKWSWRNWLRWGSGRLPSEWSGWKSAHEEELRAYWSETRCEQLWVFRFYLFPWARSWLDRGGKAWLDLDEAESSSRARQAELFVRMGEVKEAPRLQEEAEIYRRLENRFLPRFETVVTASDIETSRVMREARMQSVVTWPNIVSLPQRNDLRVGRRQSQRRLLFVGSLGHFPNREAIRFAAEEILPRLQEMSKIPVTLAVAGSGADAHREAFADLVNVEWLGEVKELAPVYAGADMVLVPLRAGGGTRIKILEAFAHRRAVVSTTIGAEGLGVVHDRELVLADTTEGLARACADLLADGEKRNRLVEAAYAYVTAYHSEGNLRDNVQSLWSQFTTGSGA